MRGWIFLGCVACGGGIEPTPDCETYVACVRAHDAALGIETDLDRFESGGACWDNGEIATLCDDGCRNGLDWLRTAWDPAPEACR